MRFVVAPPPRPRLVQSLSRTFARGLIVLVPIALTIWAAVLVVGWLDGLIAVRFGPDAAAATIPGLGVVLLLALVFFIGALTALPPARRAIDGLEWLFGRVPVARVLHASLKDMTSALVGRKKNFDKPVLVTLPGGGSGAPKALGYVTAAAMGDGVLGGYVAVYFPQAYNFAGQVILFPEADVEPLDAPSSEVMAFILSGGVSGSLAAAANPERQSRDTDLQPGAAPHLA